MRRAQLVSRIALFAALIYVLSWLTAWLPNVNLIFFVVFSAGFLWGALPGALTGAVGMGLWTSFNPYGPAMFPIAAAQVIGAGLGGLVGAGFRAAGTHRLRPIARSAALIAAAVISTLVFYLPVSAADAWMFGPFWPRFAGGMVWSGWSLVSNAVIFPLLFGVTLHLFARERERV